MQQLPRGSVVLLAAVVAVGAACSRSEASSPAGAAASSVAAAGDTATDVDATAQVAPSTAVSTNVELVATSAPRTLPATNPPITVVDVDEVGTPGLDSADAFCSAWSRFAGSFQVVSVTAAFGSGSPEQLAALEVAAAPTVVDAYDDLFDNWPSELADEEDLVSDQFLGPFARRLQEAAASLTDVGASADTLGVIRTAWLDGLARRDPSTPEFVVDLPDDVWDTIDRAAAEFAARRVPFGADPSLVTNVETPLTREYLAVSCPDQGTLSGQEVDTP